MTARRRRLVVITTLGVLLALVAVPVLAWANVQHARSPQHKDVGEPPAGAREVTLDGVEGADLAAWYLPPPVADCPDDVVCTQPPPAPGVVIVHGISSSREFMRDRIDAFAAAGFAVLAIDQRGQGESTGRNTLGEAEHRDALVAVRWLADQPEVDAEAVSLVGASFGGLVALVAAAAEPQVAAVVAESPARSALGFAGGGWFGRLGLWLHGIDGESLSSVVAVEQLRGRPVLVVVGELESTATARAIVDAGEAELWIAPGGHTQAPTVDPEGYGDTVVAFVRRATFEQVRSG